MPPRWMLGLLCLALPVGAPLAARTPAAAPAQLARCAAHAKPTLTGLEAVRTACPGIDQAIEKLGLSALLPAHWQATVTPRALADLAALAHRYSGPPPSAAPDASALRVIVQRLEPLPPPPGWWDRVGSWLRSRTAPLVHRLRRWLGSLARTAAHKTLTYVLFDALGGLLLLSIAVFVLIELRAAGLIGPQRRRARADRRAGTARPAVRAVLGSEPDWGRLREQPARLLRMLVQTLASTHRIERDRHLTCREITAQARFDSSRQREDFEQVARLAERALYGPDTPAPVPEATLRAAQALRAELLGPARRGAGAP